MFVTRSLARSANAFIRISSNKSQNNVVFNDIHRQFSITCQAFGPGADNKYKSEDQRDQEQQKIKQGKNRVLGASVVGGLVVGSLWSYLNYKNKKKEEVIGNDATVKQYLLDEAPPKFKPARIIPSAVSKPQNFKITLFQYQTCPFCCKARAFLDFFGFSYDVIEVNSVMRKEVKWSKYKKVPIVVVEFGDKVNKAQIKSFELFYICLLLYFIFTALTANFVFNPLFF